MTNKFEKLIEYIINDEDQKARELFHTIVVEKSRDIYESIMDQEQMDEMVSGAPVHDALEELAGETDTEETTMEDDEFDQDHDEEEFGAEEPEQFGDEEEIEANPAEEEIEDKVMNIDAKLDELLAKFDEIMGNDEATGQEEFGAEEPAMHDEPEMDDNSMMEAEDCDNEEEEEEESKGNPFAKKDSKKKTEESRKSTTELMREYVDTIKQMDLTGDAEGTPIGATGKKTSVNTRSGSVGPGADFGGSVVKTDAKQQNQDGTRPTRASNEYTKGEGELPVAKQNVNKPGGNAGKSSFKTKEGEYSTEHPADGTAVGNDGKLSQNHKSVQKQNTGKK
jgi:hypothetical protein